jgi:hypothetical protein
MGHRCLSEQENSMDTELFEGERRALLDRDRDCSLEKHSPMVSKHRGTERQGIGSCMPPEKQERSSVLLTSESEVDLACPESFITVHETPSSNLAWGTH